MCGFVTESLRLIQSKKLGALRIPNVQWEDIGGLEDLKKEIFRSIELPLKFPHLLANSGLRRSGKWFFSEAQMEGLLKLFGFLPQKKGMFSWIRL